MKSREWDKKGREESRKRLQGLGGYERGCEKDETGKKEGVEEE